MVKTSWKTMRNPCPMTETSWAMDLLINQLLLSLGLEQLSTEDSKVRKKYERWPSGLAWRSWASGRTARTGFTKESVLQLASRSLVGSPWDRAERAWTQNLGSWTIRRFSGSKLKMLISIIHLYSKHLRHQKWGFSTPKKILQFLYRCHLSVQ